MTSSQARISISDFLTCIFQTETFPRAASADLCWEKHSKSVEKRIGVYGFKRVWLRRRPNANTRVYFLREYHYLWTRKPNKQVYTAITRSRVLVRKNPTNFTNVQKTYFWMCASDHPLGAGLCAALSWRKSFFRVWKRYLLLRHSSRMDNNALLWKHGNSRHA